MAIYRGAGGASDSVDDATVNAVAASAAAAAASATAAAGSASSAAASAASASGSVSSVTTSASNAATSASQAATSASNASTSAASASNDAAAANASALAASTSASNASNSASAAGISETNAASSASSASTSATNSANSAASALAIYGNTTAMNNAVAAASTSASNAATSASNAAASAATATTQATNASNSAVASEASKNTAVISSYNAGVSEYNASVFAANAATSATNSAAVYGGLSAVNAAVATTTTNANNAATSATNASNSATQAAASAASASAIVLGVASGLPSIRPTLNLDFANSGVVDPRITFTRASTATYYDGKTTAKAEQNLFTYSQEFDNAWSKARTTVIANVITAPDGTTTADAIYETVDTNTHYVNQSYTPNGQALTLSVYAKSGLGRDWIWFRTLVSGPSLAVAYFDVTNGTIGTVDAGLTAIIQSVGNGWYRCIITVASSSTTIDAWGFGPTSANGITNYAGDITKGTYLWGAQLEQRSSVTAYTPTTTQAITNYIPVLQTAASGVARLDHDPVTFAAKGLLIEEARTNLLTYSSEFNNAAWANFANATANTIIAPDGTLTGDTWTLSGTGGNTNQAVVVAATSATFSVYAKKGSNSVFRLLIRNTTTATNLAQFTYDFDTFTVTAVGGTGTATLTNAGNGWVRTTITVTTNITSGNTIQGYVYPADTTGIAGNYTYIWGAQLEAGAFATSYIPTTTAQATRAADSASMTGANFSSWYNTGEGTVCVEAAGATIAGGSTMYAMSDGTGNNRIVGAVGSAMLFVSSANISQVNISSGSDTAYTFTKYAGAVKVNDFALSKNGVAAVTDTVGVLPLIVDRLFFGVSATGTGSSLNGTIKKLTYYPKRLTNTELQALTA